MRKLQCVTIHLLNVVYTAWCTKVEINYFTLTFLLCIIRKTSVLRTPK